MSDDIPNQGVASKANVVKTMVDKDSPGDRSREAGVVLIHAVGLDKVGATTEQDVCHDFHPFSLIFFLKFEAPKHSFKS